MIGEDTGDVLARLAARLRELRLARNETQAAIAARIGISRETYRKMEAGDPSIALGRWIEAARLLGRLADWDAIFAPAENLFERHRQESRLRRRASRRPQTP